MSERTSSGRRITRTTSRRHSRTSTDSYPSSLTSKGTSQTSWIGNSWYFPTLPAFGFWSLFWLLVVLVIIAGIILIILWQTTCIFGCSSNSSNLNPNEANAVQSLLFGNQFLYAALGYGQTLFNASYFNSTGFPIAVFNELSLIESNELLNINTLSSLLQNNGYSPNPACVYTFTNIVTVPQYMALLASFSGYVGGLYVNSLNGINSLSTKLMVSRISTVEGQNQGYILNWVNGTGLTTPFQQTVSPLNTIYTPSQVYTALSSYYSCSFTPLPTYFIEYNGVALNVTGNSTLQTGPIANGTNPNDVNYTAAMYVNDLNVLYMGLSVETLLFDFYAIFQANFNVTNFETLASPTLNLTQTDYVNFNTMLLKHNAQATMFSNLITNRTHTVPTGATCGNYNFSGVYDVISYVRTAALLETIDKRFYTDLVTYVVDTTIQPVIGAIATTNAQNFAYIQGLIGGVPIGTTGQSSYLTPAQTVAALSGFAFNNCSAIVNLTLPTQLQIPQNTVV